MTNDPGDNSPLPDSTGNTRRRTARSSEAGSPVGSTLSIILALVGVLAGFFILRAILDDDDGNLSDGPGPVDTTVVSEAPGDSTPPSSVVVTTVPATPAATRTGAPVGVANASGVSNSAAQFSAVLVTAEYTASEPAAMNQAGSEAQATSVIYYAPGDAAAEAVATTLGTEMGGIVPQPMPTPVPVEGGVVGNATVLVMLGTDFAGKQLSNPIADGAAATPDAATATSAAA